MNNHVSSQAQLIEDLMTEIKQLKIIAKGQEKRIVWLEAYVSNHSAVCARNRSDSGPSNSCDLTDPIQV